MSATKYTPQLLNMLRSKAISYADERMEMTEDIEYCQAPSVRQNIHKKYVDYKFAELLAKEAIKASKNYSRN